ncbi:DUF3576 domain-containing protein [Pararhodobacter sp. SW119]|uniref:DUF3576 domain-containing protein n=1 Tax=Pararhodobacter sp. SW119 TaxID=2780075 RepID=UPI001AE0E04D|nr:DUF3576 domain-containing protein [Pararhodobacter sp. SW119]
MTIARTGRLILLLTLVAALSGCGGFRFGNLFGGGGGGQQTEEAPEELGRARMNVAGGGTIWDLFRGNENPGTAVAVNRYLWNASLQVLDFLPVESVDPFTGVIVTGFGTPPGGGRPYRATVHVSDGALDARALNVALVTGAGPASPETVRAVENAILTRARQLRIQDRRF